jgi:hypothetical protein
LPTTYRKSLLKCPQRADVSPFHPQESSSMGIYERESRAGTLASREAAKQKSARLSLDGAQEAPANLEAA